MSKQELKPIFYDDDSRDLWREINSLDAMSTGDDIRDVLLSVCIGIQNLEYRMNTRTDTKQE